MKVLFVTCFFEYNFGGAELVMRTLRRSLTERGHTVDVLCLAGGPSPQPGNIWRLPVPHLLRHRPQLMKRVIIFLANPVLDRWFSRRLQSLPLSRSSYALVHAHDIHSVVLAQQVAQSCYTPLGLTVQDNVPREFSDTGVNPMAAAFLRAALRRRDHRLRPLLQQLHWITAPSRHIRDKIARFLGGTPPSVFTIHSPYSADQSPGPPQDSGAAPEPHFLFMGRLSREKGVDLLLEAFTRSGAAFRLTILGLEGPLQPAVAGYAGKDSRITLRPPVPHAEVPAILEQHDVVCCLSTWNDPLPGAVIEARLHRKAVLASNLGGIPEIVQNYPRAALVDVALSPRSELVKVIQAGLAEAARLTRVPLDATEEEAFVRQFSPRNCADQFETLYRTGSVR